jgi:transcriptional regulator with XRE-family HTH domain
VGTKHSDKYKKIGNRIKFYRNKNKLSQAELAIKAGISKSYLSKIEAENCDKSFSLEVLFDIADALEIPIIKLLE